MRESGNGIQDHNGRQEIDAKQKLVEEANRKEEQAQLLSFSPWKDNQDGLSFVTQKERNTHCGPGKRDYQQEKG